MKIWQPTSVLSGYYGLRVRMDLRVGIPAVAQSLHGWRPSYRKKLSAIISVPHPHRLLDREHRTFSVASIASKGSLLHHDC